MTALPGVTLHASLHPTHLPTHWCQPHRSRSAGEGARVLGLHHFAFVRESLLGLNLAEAFHRYLACSETSAAVRHVQRRRD